jgi:hypothetical protein
MRPPRRVFYGLDIDGKATFMEDGEAGSRIRRREALLIRPRVPAEPARKSGVSQT